MDYKMFGARIRVQRKALGLTQEQLAEKAGISLSFLGHLERGARQPSIDTLVALANTLRVSTDELLRDSLGEDALSYSKEEMNRRQMLKELNHILQKGVEYWSDT